MPPLQPLLDRVDELAVVAVAALFIGGFLDRCIVRLALEKSIVWPLGRYCQRCHQRLPSRFSTPIFGPLLCWFRCSSCKQPLPKRGPLVELLTVTLLCGLYTSHVIYGGMFAFPDLGPFTPGATPSRHFALFIYHSILVCFLIVTTFIDLDYMIVPDSVTFPGIALGLAVGGLWYVELHPVVMWMWQPFPDINALFEQSMWNGIWNDWMGGDAGLPGWAERLRAALDWHWRDGGNCVHWFGFATGLVGAVVGAGVTWIIRGLLSWAFGREAMGFGDVILMAMIGSFVGWQSAIIVLVVFAPISGIVVGLLGWVFSGRVEFAFVPHLSIGTIVLLFTWRPVWRHAYFGVFDLVYSFSGHAALATIVLLFLLVVVALFVQWTKGIFGRAFQG